jgi:hypothetical protein
MLRNRNKKTKYAMKLSIFAVIVIQINLLFGQIEVISKPVKDSLYRNIAYGFLNVTNVNRTLSPNENFIPGIIGERANETALRTYSFGLGLKGHLTKRIIWDGGISYLQNGEQYEFIAFSKDTSFSYQTYYKYIAMPLKLNFIVGNFVQFYGGIGILPQLFLSYRQNQQWETTLGSKDTDIIRSKNDYNSFITSVLINLGLSITTSKGVGVFISPEYRYQLQNGYGKLSSFKHKSFGLGVSFGISKEL